MYDLPVELDHYPRFILQLAPHSNNGSTCRFSHCTARINPGQYRIALTPGRSDPRGPGETISPAIKSCIRFRCVVLHVGFFLFVVTPQLTNVANSTIDYYHVRCFENLVHMSSPHYAARFDADQEKYTPDRGAQCILEEYIARWKLRLTKAQNNENSSSSTATEVVGAGQSVILQTHPPTAKVIEQQEKSPSLEFSAVKKSKWVLADEMYEQVRKAKTERRRHHTSRFSCKSLLLI
jgi:hypothetical protein